MRRVPRKGSCNFSLFQTEYLSSSLQVPSSRPFSFHRLQLHLSALLLLLRFSLLLSSSSPYSFFRLDLSSPLLLLFFVAPWINLDLLYRFPSSPSSCLFEPRDNASLDGVAFLSLEELSEEEGVVQ